MALYSNTTSGTVTSMKHRLNSKSDSVNNTVTRYQN